MLIVVTGGIGSGKSTVCLGLLAWAKGAGCKCGGVLSHKASGGVIVAENILTGERANLAGPPDLYSGPKLGNFSFSPRGISFGTEAVREGMSTPLCVIDELGPLELAGQGFSNAVPLLRSQQQGDQVVVIRDELVGHFLPLFGRKALVLRTTLQGRDVLPWQIGRLLESSVGRKVALADELRR